MSELYELLVDAGLFTLLVLGVLGILLYNYVVSSENEENNNKNN